jgi:sporulation protein YlmC with PRC-barrel domain
MKTMNFVPLGYYPIALKMLARKVAKEDFVGSDGIESPGRSKESKRNLKLTKERLMKYKLLLPTLALCAGSLFVSPALADHEKGLSHTDASMQSIGDFRISNLINAKVKDSAGDRVGQIEDFVVEPNSGRIQFAILKLTGDLAKGGEYTPVPWPLISKANVDVNKAGEPKTVVLNVDRSRLASAQRFSVNRWPDRNHPVWGQEVYTYYGVPWDTTVVGSGATGSFSTETPPVIVQQPPSESYYYAHPNPRDRYTHYSKPIDNGTAPDGKDVFKFSPRPWPYSEYYTE